jgi:hypothetical protein
MLLAIMDKYKGESDFSSKMESDLRSISAILKSSPQDWSTITFPSPPEMKELLYRVYALSSKNKSAQPVNHQLLRLYLFLIDRYQEKMWPAGPTDEMVALNRDLKIISDSIGVVPRLSHPVVWADQEFLPPEINRKTKKNWQKQGCPTPHRGKTVAKNEVHFIGTPKEALTARYSATPAEHIDTRKESLYLNLIDFDYYKLGLMDTDHLLPSASLPDRLQEMIQAMNYDPEFAREMKNSIFNDNYFIIDNSGVIVGNYWLYMAYHNSIENLWLLLASDNGAAEKGAKDPLVWLKQLELGKKYEQHLKEAGKHVDKSGILYRVSTGGEVSMSLKDSFTSWVRESHQDQILVYNGEAKLHQKMRDKIYHAGDSREKLMEVHGNIAVTKAHFFNSDADSETSSFTSVGSSIARQFEKQYIETIIQDSVTKELVRDTKKRTKEIGSEAKQTVKRQCLGI